MCGLVRPPPYTQHPVRKAHPCCGAGWHVTPFYGCRLFHRAHGPRSVYSSIRSWRFGLLPFGGCCELRRFEYAGTHFGLDRCSGFFQVFWRLFNARGSVTSARRGRIGETIKQGKEGVPGSARGESPARPARLLLSSSWAAASPGGTPDDRAAAWRAWGSQPSPCPPSGEKKEQER